MKYQLGSFIHNCIAHPLLFWSNDSKWAVKFHNWTAELF